MRETLRAIGVATSNVNVFVLIALRLLDTLMSAHQSSLAASGVNII